MEVIEKKPLPPKKPPKKIPPAKPDTAHAAVGDTARADTVTQDTTPVFLPCQNDTTKPYVYPDPSGGLHYGTIHVYFKTSKPCTIEWKFGGEKIWHPYQADSVDITRSTLLFFKATDSCGNSTDIRSERYDINPPLQKKYCSQDMEYVKVEGARFCIDRYEWPNKKGTRPCSNVSLYQAEDSCFLVGKRLCTTDEWSLACGGIYTLKYPYSDAYESRACVTKDTSTQPSGSKTECRGYFKVFDMSGNLAEWTSTRSKTNSYFFNVMGGFWSSGPQSSCFEPRYSYYPQNKHNPVGLRCCTDANKESE
jgi:hypothetical protein